MALLSLNFSRLLSYAIALGVSTALLPFAATATLATEVLPRPRVTPSAPTEFPSSDILPSRPLVLAELNDLCNDGESTFLMIETENFWASICGGDAPYTYVGMDKSTGDSIEVPLVDYASDGSWFEAVNGDYRYMIIFDTPKGHFLTVTVGDETILQEYLVDWY